MIENKDTDLHGWNGYPRIFGMECGVGQLTRMNQRNADFADDTDCTDLSLNLRESVLVRKMLNSNAESQGRGDAENSFAPSRLCIFAVNFSTSSCR